MAAGAGALWVASEEAGTVTRIEPRSGTVVQPIPVGNGPSAVASAKARFGSSTATTGRSPGSTRRRTRCRGPSRVGGEPRRWRSGDGAVWVAGGEDGTIARVDPEATAWSSGPRPGTAHRRSRSRAAGCGRRRARRRPRTAAARFASSSPRASGRSRSTGWTEHGYDLGKRRRRPRWPTTASSATGASSGAAGATLVGALATDAPPPSHDGRTYVFTLRRGTALLRRQARPARRTSAPRWSASSTRSARRIPPVLRRPSSERRGACDRRARCDLSRGIETDPRARTITIHLTRPDARPPAQADPAVRLCRAVRYAAASHRRSRAAGHGAVPVRKLERAPGRNPGAQPVLPIAGAVGRAPSASPTASRSKCAAGASATSRSRSRMSNAGRPTSRSSPPRQTPTSSAPSASGSSPPIAGPAPQRADGRHRLDVPQRPAAPVRLAPRPPRAELRDRPSAHRRHRRRTRDRQPNVPDRAEGLSCLPAVLPVHRPEDRAGRGWTCARRRAGAPPDSPIGEGGRTSRRVGARASSARSAATITALLDELGFEASLRVIGR